MFSGILKTSWRNLSRDRTYNAINIIGLAAGLSSFIIILLYLNYELSYDKWNPHLGNVFRISLKSESGTLPQTPAPLAAFLAQNYSAAEAATSIQPADDYELMISTEQKKLYQKGVVIVDSLFMRVFPYKLIKGNANTALNQPNAAIISEELSQKLFGTTNPLGKTLKVHNSMEGIVTGVMQFPKTPSHINISLLLRNPYEKQDRFWENYSYHTYIILKSKISQPRIEDDINRLYYNERIKKDNIPFEHYKRSGEQTALFIDAVPDIHNFPKYGSSNFTTVSILLGLAMLLLLAGAINFSNLAIAKSIKRAKEVGVRKTLGSGTVQLIVQFMFETALQCVISLCISIVIVYLALPYLNRSFGIDLRFWKYDTTASLVAQIILCLSVVILISGLYPSFFLSRFNPNKVLKGDFSTGKTGKVFRNSLIVVQFMVSAFFIVATLVISTQMNYMKNKDKGFTDTQVLRIEAMQNTREGRFDGARNTLLSLPGVAYVAKSTNVPGDRNFGDTSTISFKYSGKEYRMSSVKISTDYFNALEVSLVKGRLFSSNYADQHTRTAIINETAAKNLNMPNSLGQTIYFPDCDTVPVQIVGIVKDFNVG
ncbi:MAG TPA: ABC transporter permease, partial [Flavitalea sp.]|nr:ABC transporter permease [Flavitalea sp.]